MIKLIKSNKPIKLSKRIKHEGKEVKKPSYHILGKMRDGSYVEILQSHHFTYEEFSSQSSTNKVKVNEEEKEKND